MHRRPDRGGRDGRRGSARRCAGDARHRPPQPDEDGRADYGIALSGGSLFGLSTGDGVLRYLEEKNIGIVYGGRHIPIVPGASIFDLGVGDATSGRPPTAGIVRPRRRRRRLSWKAASAPGPGQPSAKSAGMAHAMKSGVGSAAVRMPDGVIMAALVVANPLGDVIDPATGKVVAGVRTPAGEGFADARVLMRGGRAARRSAATTRPSASSRPTRGSRRRRRHSWRRLADDGYARAIWPIHTRRRRHGVRDRDRHGGRRSRIDARRAGGRRHGRGGHPRRDAGDRPAESARGAESWQRPAANDAVSGRSRLDRREFLGARAHSASPACFVVRRLRAASMPKRTDRVRRRSSLPRVRARRRRSASPPGTSATAARSSGAAPIARRGCSSSIRPRSASPMSVAWGAGGDRGSDFTSRTVLTDLPPGSGSSIASCFRISSDLRTWSEPARAASHTPSARRATSRSRGRQTPSGRAGASTRDWGGLRLYDTMRRRAARRLHPCRRHHLRRPAAAIRSEAGRRHDLEEPGDRGEVESRADAGRLPRLPSVQPHATNTCAGSSPRSRRS